MKHPICLLMPGKMALLVANINILITGNVELDYLTFITLIVSCRDSPRSSLASLNTASLSA